MVRKDNSFPFHSPKLGIQNKWLRKWYDDPPFLRGKSGFRSCSNYLVTHFFKDQIMRPLSPPFASVSQRCGQSSVTKRQSSREIPQLSLLQIACLVGRVIQSGKEASLLLLGNTMIPPYYFQFHKHRQQELAMEVLTPQ